MATDPITKACRELCRKFPHHPARAIARKLVERTNGAITLDGARSRVRYQFGQHGKKNAPYSGAVAKRAARAPGQGIDLPPTLAEPWTVHDFGVVGLVGVISDLHVPYHSEIAVKAAVELMQDREISGLLINGDFCDFYAISRFDKDPAKRDFKGELAGIREVLGSLRAALPDIPIVLKSGNHEERWAAWLWQHAPEISDMPEMGLDRWLHLDKHQITLVEDKRIVMLGQLPVLHGHEKGKGISSPVNQARGAFLRLNHTVLEGHGHRTSGHCEPDMFGREVFCWSTGCLCELHPAYAPINKMNWGFALVDVQADGEFDVTNLRITAEGKVRQS